MKKVLSFILAFTLVFSVVAFSRVLNVSAALDDGKKLSVNVDLEIGTKSGDTLHQSQKVKPTKPAIF